MFCDKIKKITEALYRVTELYSDKEPLKWQMRTTGLELFNFLTSNEEKEIFDANKIFDLIRQLNRLLQLAYSSSTFVSSINFEILRREYLSLSDSIATQMEKRKQEFLSLENLLPISIGQTADSNGQQLLDNGHNGQATVGSSTSHIQDEQNGQSPEPALSVGRLAEGQPILLKERKRKILTLIKDNNADNSDKWMTIREISSSLPEYGGKSIQRDLLELVEAGVLKKAGDKRWRKYAVAA
ncbi:MAG: hypothetical protein Q8N42_00765 [bacterium]|nr:hypothetical protein [bacterium]